MHYSLFQSVSLLHSLILLPGLLLVSHKLTLSHNKAAFLSTTETIQRSLQPQVALIALILISVLNFLV